MGGELLMNTTGLAKPTWLAGLATLGLIAGLTSTAMAQVKLPNGATIPAGGGPALSGYLNGSANNDNINEGINVVTEAATEPQVFSPLCDFAGKYIAKGGGANFAIGWYNVDSARASNNPPKYVPTNLGAGLNTPAANSDIQILFPFSNALPAADMRDLKAATIRSNPNYKNGLIGFALIPNPNGTMANPATQYHYTEHRFNIQCTKCTGAGEKNGPWYSILTYKSKKLDSTFYLGFEDLDFADASGAAGTNGNDLDYEDFLFRFTGIACVGAGTSCTVPGQQGSCQFGVTECDGQGTLFCKQLTQPGTNTEKCDGIDNDCNGTVDENAPCPVGQLCDKGRCTMNCSGEFPCADGLSCDQGRCVDPACVGKDCGGQICRLGTCVSPCTGIVCPQPYVCSGGNCVDPCKGVTCPANKTCSNGACITACNCLPCGSGQACAPGSGRCVEQGCEAETCGVGTLCKAGTCVPACTIDVKCPPGQTCTMGACVDQNFTDPTPDGGTDDAGVELGGAVATGCTCNFAPSQSASTAWGLFAGLAVMATALRLSRRRNVA